MVEDDIALKMYKARVAGESERKIAAKFKVTPTEVRHAVARMLPIIDTAARIRPMALIYPGMLNSVRTLECPSSGHRQTAETSMISTGTPSVCPCFVPNRVSGRVLLNSIVWVADGRRPGARLFFWA